MFGHKLKISDSLHERLQKVAEEKGYSSAVEYAMHLLETAAGAADNDASEKDVEERLRGLGYIE